VKISPFPATHQWIAKSTSRRIDKALEAASRAGSAASAEEAGAGRQQSGAKLRQPGWLGMIVLGAQDLACFVQVPQSNGASAVVTLQEGGPFLGMSLPIEPETRRSLFVFEQAQAQTNTPV